MFRLLFSPRKGDEVAFTGRIPEGTLSLAAPANQGFAASESRRISLAGARLWKAATPWVSESTEAHLRNFPPAIHPREPPVTVCLCSSSSASEHLTYALRALCGNSVVCAIENCVVLVQKLWRSGILCGKRRKNRTKTATVKNFQTVASASIFAGKSLILHSTKCARPRQVAASRCSVDSRGWLSPRECRPSKC